MVAGPGWADWWALLFPTANNGVRALKKAAWEESQNPQYAGDMVRSSVWVNPARPCLNARPLLSIYIAGAKMGYEADL